MNKRATYALAVAAGGCTILEIVSLATPYWLGPTFGTSEGLFELCQKYVGCFRVHDAAAFVQAVRAFVIISVLLSAACVVVCVAVSLKKLPSKLIPLLFFITAVTMVIPMAIFTGKVSQRSYYDYGWSYYLGWVAFACNLVLMVVSGFLVKSFDYSSI